MRHDSTKSLSAWQLRRRARRRGGLLAGLVLGLVGLVGPWPVGSVARADDERTTTYVPAVWVKSQVWDYFRRAPQFGWSFDVFFRGQGSYAESNPFANRLRESYRPWFVWQINPLNRLSVAPISYHRDDGLRWNENIDLSRVRHELRSSVEFDSGVFLHKRVMLSHRYRLEGRSFADESWENRRYLLRFRARLRVRFSLNNKSYFERNVVYLAGYNEVALHFGRSQPWAFNQNRSYLGLGYRFGAYSRVELGYINQWRGGAGVPDYHSNHGPMVYLMFDYLSAELGGLRAQREAKRRSQGQRRGGAERP